MPKTVILSSRTPTDKLGGSLASLDAPTLGGIAISAAGIPREVSSETVNKGWAATCSRRGQGDGMLLEVEGG